MTKRPTRGPCVYCLKERERTWDHVLPAAWYPDSTPTDIEKWKVPACLSCNNRLGKAESEVLVRLALCLDPNDPKSRGITQKAVRSLNPRFGKSEKDRQARERKRKQILKESEDLGPDLPIEHLLPGFGPQPDFGPGPHHATLVKQRDLDAVSDKIIRGLTFLREAIPLPHEYTVNIYFIRESGNNPVQRMFDNAGGTLTRGPGFLVKYGVLAGDRLAGIYMIDIWGRLRFYASVLPPGMHLPPGGDTLTSA